MSLQVIQQVSQYTVSCTQSIRDYNLQNSANISINQHIQNQQHQNSIKTQINQQQSNQQQLSQSKYRTKNFVKSFRKHIDSCVAISQQQIISSNINSNKSSYNNSIDQSVFQDIINLPKYLKSPKPMPMKKHSQRILTTYQDNKQNNCQNQIQKPIRNHRRNLSQGNYERQKNSLQQNKISISRSNSKANSKQKIKVASKIIQQLSLKTNRKLSLTNRPSVHLGGKQHLKKIAKQIRIALQQLLFWQGNRDTQIKYEGQKKNNMKWGKGKLLYSNGFQYQGQFVQDYKHGNGKISLNNIIFYQGQWSLNQISGQGYIKSLKHFTINCPKSLSDSSYCGQLLQNKLHGMGTLFLNNNQKIVTKFVHGVPVGDFTYYNHSQIQFSSWF